MCVRVFECLCVCVRESSPITVRKEGHLFMTSGREVLNENTNGVSESERERSERERERERVRERA